MGESGGSRWKLDAQGGPGRECWGDLRNRKLLGETRESAGISEEVAAHGRTQGEQTGRHLSQSEGAQVTMFI